MDSRRPRLISVIPILAEVRLYSFSHFVQLVDTYGNNVPSCGGEVIYWGCACGCRHNFCGGAGLKRRLILSKTTHIKTHEWDLWQEADAQVRLQMDSQNWIVWETISLVSDHCGLLIVLLMVMSKTRVDVMKVWGLSKSALMPLKAVTDTCSYGAAGSLRYDISIYCICTCRWLPLTGPVCRLTYKPLVVFRQSKTGLWASKIGFIVTPTLLGWNKELDVQMLGSGLLLWCSSHNSRKTVWLTLQRLLPPKSNPTSTQVLTPIGRTGCGHQAYVTVCYSPPPHVLCHNSKNPTNSTSCWKSRIVW